MPLKLITGPKRSGKTSYIINELKLNKKSIIIVPEQTLFLYEKTILEKLGEEHSFNIKIFSFKKIAKELIKNDQSFNRIKLLDTDLKSLIIEKIIINNMDKLLSLKNAVGSPEMSAQIGAQISEFKKYLIDNKKVEELLSDDKINKALKDKIADISFLYNEYEERIKDIYLDLDNLTEQAANKIISENLYSDFNIYIDSFTGFTGEELYMIKAFLQNNAKVFIALTELEGRFSRFGDLAYTINITKNKLIKLCDNEFEEIKLKESYIKNPEIKFLADNIYSDDSLFYNKPSQSIKVVKSKGIKHECELLASEIIKNIKRTKVSLNKMAVVVPDIKEYGSYIKDSLESFNFPYYSNEKKSVYDMPVAALLSNVFNIILSGNRMDVIIGYLKSGYFFKNNPDFIYKFEEFIRKTGIRAYQLINKPFSEIIAEKKAFDFKINDEKALTLVYDKAIYPVVELREKINNSSDVMDYSLCLYEFFNKIGLDKTLAQYASEYEEAGDIVKGKQLIQVYNYILESMERTTLVLSEDKVSFQEYKNIIISSLKNKNIGSIPILCDSIFITEPSGFFNDDYSHIYILGANDGKLPYLSFKEGIINEEERQALKNLGIELSMSRELKIMENKLKVYDILSSPSESLYISYSNYSKGGSEQTQSDFVYEVCELFSINEEMGRVYYSTKRSLLKDTLSGFSKKKLIEDPVSISYLCEEKKYLDIINETISNLKNPQYKNIKVSKKNMKKLIGDSLKISTTNMEKYNTCAFSYFIRYVLYAKEKQEFSINSMNLGTVMHHIIEKFSVCLKKDNMEFSNIDDNYIKEKLDKIIESSIKETQHGVFVSDIKSELFKRRLRATAYKTIYLLRKHFTEGSFKSVGFEVDFGKDESEIEGIVFDAGNNRKIILNGVIDRVDSFKKDSEEYIRIVDYKSSEKTIDFYEVVTGLKMQLAIYLMTMLGEDKINKIKPGGMLYLSLKTPMISISSPKDKDKVEAQIKQKLTMKGFYLNTQTVVEAMDKNLKDNKKSEIVDIEIDSMGLPKNKNTLSLSEFKVMLNYVKKNIESQGKNIFDGKFPISPIKNKQITSCDYCPYSCICMFDSENDEVVNIKKLSRDEIFK